MNWKHLASVLRGPVARDTLRAQPNMWEALLMLSDTTFCTNYVIGNYKNTTAYDVVDQLRDTMRLLQEEIEEFKGEVNNFDNSLDFAKKMQQQEALGRECADMFTYLMHILNLLDQLAVHSFPPVCVPDGQEVVPQAFYWVANNNGSKIYKSYPQVLNAREYYLQIGVVSETETIMVDDKELHVLRSQRDQYDNKGKFYRKNKILKRPKM